MLSPHFNPRSPCGERPNLAPFLSSSFVFQSTLPVRGATIIRCVVNLHRLRFQSTLPVRGATCRLYRDAQRFAISIHAPRAGSDTQLRRADRQKGHFNPRSPCGERHLDSIGSTKRYISIHAPRAGSDHISIVLSSCNVYFNPRSPCGERRLYAESRLAEYKFQSTLPVRGATARRPGATVTLIFQSTLPVRGATHKWRNHCRAGNISIHAPRAGSDTTAALRGDEEAISIHAPRAGSDGNNTHPGRHRRISIHAPRAGSDRKHGRRNERGAISIHAPRAGSDEHALPLNQQGMWISIHAPRAGSDDNGNNKTTPSSDFNPRSPCGERPA